jgi:hypothetical protein
MVGAMPAACVAFDEAVILVNPQRHAFPNRYELRPCSLELLQRPLPLSST